jgi:formylglycine-generating enzyme required for sulfatase activity
VNRIFVLICAMCLVAPRVASAVTINWLPVGNPGNAADLDIFGDTYGAVGYGYSIDKYDVTNAQYVDFLNAKDPTGANLLGLAGGTAISFASNAAVGNRYSTFDPNGPVNSVSWYSAARFANWLSNGQGNSSTETGAYTLIGGTPIPSNGLTVSRNAGTHVFIPSRDEWYKAAYFNPATSSYFLFPTSSNTQPTAIAPPGGPNSGNYHGAVGHPTDVGAYTATTSPIGAFDMGGDVAQWNEAIVTSQQRRATFGGSFAETAQQSGSGSSLNPQVGNPDIGFRVVMAPEPSSAVLAALGFALAAWGWRRKRA